MMLNEFEEFKAYMTFPDYTIKSKRDTGYLGRFTYKMIKEFRGFNRILTILARGYMWETDVPDVERAYRALCAWCSLPESVKPDRRKAGQDRTCFSDLHDEFPELVNEDGEGWYFTHVHNVAAAVLDNAGNNTNSMASNALTIVKKFNKGWCNKVMQAQASLYTKTTKGAWIIRFEDIVAEAKELGPLKNNDIDLPAETVQKLTDALFDKKQKNVFQDLAKFYLANKPYDSEWVILPVENFNAYYGTTSFDRKWLPDFPESILVREEYSGVCRFKMIL